MINLLTELIKFKGLEHRFVYLRKDNNGLYIEYAFMVGHPHDNKCLSKYTEDLMLDTIYQLSEFSCSDADCSPGHPKKECSYVKGMTPAWTSENPGKCACWYLENVDFGKYKFNFTEDEIKLFINQFGFDFPKTTNAINPNAIKVLQNDSIPGFVIEAVNKLIIQNLKGGSVTLLQKDIVTAIIKQAKPKRISKDKIFDSGWLDFEDIFREAGWDVYYDKPGYNEDYDAYFRFSK